MNVIGNLKPTGKHFVGTISTLTLSIPVTFTALEKRSDKSPDYRITSGRAEIGAGWKKRSESGVDYVSVTIDDPSFRLPITASLFSPDDGEDFHRLVWSRPEPKN